MNEGNQTPSQLMSYINAFLSTIAKLKLVSSLLKASKITINDIEVNNENIDNIIIKLYKEFQI